MTLECATCLEPRTELQVTSKAGRDSIEKEEGYAGIWPDHCTPKKQTNCKVSGDKYGLYHDSRGICTKGIGHRVIETQSEGPCTPETISEFRREFKAGMPYAEAYKQFLKDIKREGEDPVNRNLKVKLTQEQFDALVSFSFNAGMGSLVKSPLLKDINAGKCDPDTIRADFLAWPNKDRRAKEANLFISGEYF